MNIENIKLEIDNARKNKTGHVFKKIFLNTPSWDQIINYLNFEYNNKNSSEYYQEHINKGYFDKPEYNEYGEIIKNGLILYKDKDLYVSCSIKDSIKSFPQTEGPIKLFREVLNDPYATFGQVFVNFVSNDNQIAMHLDQRETIFWLCQGKVTWVLADPDDWSKTTRYELEAGDVMFAPFGLPHTVESHSPRAGLVFSAFYENYDRYIENTQNDRRTIQEAIKEKLK